MAKSRMQINTLLRSISLTLLVVPSFALAQSAPAPGPQTPTPVLSGRTEAAIDQRIDALKAQLAITTAQTTVWDIFAQTMRDNAARTDALFAQRAAGAATMTAVDNMHSYTTIAQAYADNTARLSAAFDNLYATLSPGQKHAADVLFREQAAAKK
jgi:periplasmic protein CpxP/Spy